MGNINNPELRVALLGQGFMGKAHANAFAQCPRFFDVPYRLRLKVLCGRDEGQLGQAAERWGWEETATDWRAVVERQDIDVVDIALPNHLHREAAVAAAEAGKIVLCEKPLANTLEDAEAIAVAARNVRTMVWFNYRRVPAVALARDLIAKGTLGDIFHYRGRYFQQWGADPNRPVNWKMHRAEAGSGVVGDLLSHSIDLAESLNGSIASLTATTSIIAPGREVEDAVAVLVKFANGSMGTLEASRFAIGYRNGNAFEVQGSKGAIGFDLEHLTYLTYFNAADPEALSGPRLVPVTNTHFWKPGHVVGYEHTFIAALAEFLIALGKNEAFHPDFADGLRVQKVIDGVLRSADSGHWIEV